jgi:MoxR-like ATPase
LGLEPATPLLSRRDDILAVVDTLCGCLQGKVRTIRLCVTALLAGGNILLEDLPGLGKTTLALALSRVLGLSFGRIQCTSDLLPSDITGLSIFNRDDNCFTFLRGPLFTNLLLVDEINRAMPKTQSALLEAMEERKVTVEGTTYDLPSPFLVVATQNPVEQVGTHPLPESQLDRFLICTGVGYPPEEIEKRIIRGGSIRDELNGLAPVISLEALQEAQVAVRERVFLSEKVTEYLFRIVAATRSHPLISSGLSTRAGINLAEAARANAYLEGRDYVIPEDVKELVIPVGAHRLITVDRDGLNKELLLRSILKEISVPLA